MGRNWTSYDPVAETYDRLAAPHLFVPVARDLLALLNLPQPALVLDVGTGTGAGGLAALKSPGCAAIGLDPALEMLRQARGKGLTRLVRGMAPGLPFREAVFDGVLAGFVLSHITPYPAALADMVRVLRPGGRLAASAWGPLQNEFRQFWRNLAESVLGKQALQDAVREAIPWEEWFSDPRRLSAAFEEAGLIHVEVHPRELTARMTIPNYLAMRELSVPARFARETLGPDRWERFQQTAREAFYARFREPIVDTTVACLCVGARP